MFGRLLNFKADMMDIALTKIAVFAGALFIAKIWDPILSLDWYWYILVCILAAIKPLKSFYDFSKSDEELII